MLTCYIRWIYWLWRPFMFIYFLVILCACVNPLQAGSQDFMVQWPFVSPKDPADRSKIDGEFEMGYYKGTQFDSLVTSGPIRVQDCQIDSAIFNGPSDISDSKIKELVANGPIKLVTTTVDRMTINGPGQLKRVTTKEDLTINGPLRASGLKAGKIVASAAEVVLAKSTVSEIVIKEPENGSDEQVLRLASTTIKGDIIFKSGKGRVILQDDKVKYKRLIGATIDEREEDS